VTSAALERPVSDAAGRGFGADPRGLQLGPPAGGFLGLIRLFVELNEPRQGAGHPGAPKNWRDFCFVLPQSVIPFQKEWFGFRVSLLTE